MGKVAAPKQGPDPTLISRKEVDALYTTLQVVVDALDKLRVDYIVTGGSLLGAIRQHSILFCDDDIDISIIDHHDEGPGDGSAYQRVKDQLQALIGKRYQYQIAPWEGGDRIRPKQMNNIFIDIFVIRRYESMDQLVNEVVGVKANGQRQQQAYIDGIVDTIASAAASATGSDELASFWHFAKRKAVEMWPKEVYRQKEMFPLQANLKMGPVVHIKGPQTPVLLLKRAFGDDCFDVYYQSTAHQAATSSSATTHVANHGVANGEDDTGTDLPPLIAPGGTWMDSTKQPLQDKHYLPMQPTSRAARRPTNFNKEELLKYLEVQGTKEHEWLASNNDNGNGNGTMSNTKDNITKVGTVYMDGVFDLFHVGHLEAIKQCSDLGHRVIIGVTGDDDAAGYKRPPVIRERDRVAIIEAIKYVDEVVCPCPLIVTAEFMAARGIDLVVHGFMNDADRERQREFFEVPVETGRFREIAYYRDQSTTKIISTIEEMLNSETSTQPSANTIASASIAPGASTTAVHAPAATTTAAAPAANTMKPNNPKWFGSSLASATNHSKNIPFHPFPLHLRQVMEPHLQKTLRHRSEALQTICDATGKGGYGAVMKRFLQGGLALERDLSYDAMQHPLRTALLQSFGLPSEYDLTLLHEDEGRKYDILQTLTTDNHHASFQAAYDDFVHSFCIPHLSTIAPNETEFYYQSFPCVRIVQPGEFSIGPHADVMYGHHPCSINLYVPITEIGNPDTCGNASSLFLESQPNAQDWHPIIGALGRMKQFAGAVCTHWTTDNATCKTRVSLDFRVIAGSMYKALSHPNVYQDADGYYSRCVHSDETRRWQRADAENNKPDARVGFPWTVKDWEKLRHKMIQKKAKRQ